jgi:porin
MNPNPAPAKALLLFAAIAALAIAAPANAQPYPAPPTWGGDLQSRARLTGDWGGTRDEWSKHGFNFDEDVYWTPSAIVDGGKNETGGNWGNAVTSMHLDTGKAGWWKGGYFKFKAVTSFGHNIYTDTGALVPPNEGWALPTLQAETGLQEFSLVQLLSPKFGVLLGKMDLSVTPNQFYGDYRTGWCRCRRSARAWSTCPTMRCT